jgi:nitrogen regulatory protein PII
LLSIRKSVLDNNGVEISAHELSLESGVYKEEFMSKVNGEEKITHGDDYSPKDINKKVAEILQDNNIGSITIKRRLSKGQYEEKTFENTRFQAMNIADGKNQLNEDMVSIKEENKKLEAIVNFDIDGHLESYKNQLFIKDKIYSTTSIERQGDGTYKKMYEVYDGKKNAVQVLETGFEISGAEERIKEMVNKKISTLFITNFDDNTKSFSTRTFEGEHDYTGGLNDGRNILSDLIQKSKNHNLSKSTESVIENVRDLMTAAWNEPGISTSDKLAFTKKPIKIGGV